ncbi:amidohydrolase family protein [Acidobacteria bacterium AH-259-D05]|nr:amidohydrolase family protein [Acidobacteria bacterium AH-259-D05]
MKILLKSWLCLVLAIPSFSVSVAESLLIRGATLIDGTGSAPIPNASILIEDNLIVSVGTSRQPPSGVKVIEAQGKFVLPGFIDSHVHYRPYMGELFLAHGVTTVFDLGNPLYWQSALKKGLNKGKLRGPRFYFCGGPILSSGPRTQAWRRRPSIYTRSLVSISDPGEARRTVQALKEEGHDCVKLNENYPGEMFSAIAREAESLGMSVISHSLNALNSAEWGIDGIEHMVGIAIATISRQEGRAAVEQMTIEAGHKNSGLYPWMEPSKFDEVIQELVANEVFINPTLVFEWKALTPRAGEHELDDIRLFNIPELQYIPIDERLLSLGQYHWEDKIPSEKKELFLKGYAKVQEFLRKFVQAGGKIYAGTDTAAAATPGLSLHHELELLVDAGLSPMEAIGTVTRNASELLHLESKLGTVAPGKLADLVILNSDPLVDIGNTRDIFKVIQAGEDVDISYHSDYSNPFERPGPESKHLYHPPPRLSDISPPVVKEGQSAVLNLSGQGFVPNSVVKFGANRLETWWESAGELRAVLPASLTSRVGTFWVSVETPKPGGGSSNKIEFIVTYD